MTPVRDDQATELSRDVIRAFQNLAGEHPGFRPAHAKGILLAGVFKPSAQASSLSRAPHFNRPSTPVSVRFSDFAGVPNIPDNHPEASPRGLAVRFHLAEHVHTDITAHSVDGFPARTAEEFLEFLQAIHASGPDAPKPSPIEVFLSTHPAALEFVQAPKPLPSSFVNESYFSVSAYKFTNQSGVSRFVRYRIRPVEPAAYLDAAAAAAESPDFLFDEIKARLAKGPVKLCVLVQIAEPGDTVDNATVHWPENRQQIEIGRLEGSTVIPDNDGEQRRIIFDPIPRVDGIESSGDPLLEPRANVYLMSGRRRRAGGGA